MIPTGNFGHHDVRVSALGFGEHHLGEPQTRLQLPGRERVGWLRGVEDNQ
jgi:hypothetical protein